MRTRPPAGGQLSPTQSCRYVIVADLGLPCFRAAMTLYALGRVGLAVLLLLCPRPSPGAGAAAAPSPSSAALELGRSYTLRSRALQEDRVVNVVLPLSYATAPDRRYPVLYLIDGGVDQDLLHIAGVVKLGAMWGRSSDAILVGIATKDRRRELVGPTKDPALLKQYPTAGRSADFREFIRAEVKPFVERTYRTSGRDVVLGESLAGVFVVETYLLEPSLFDGYGAIDPSLWWDKEALSKKAAGNAGVKQKGRSLFLAFAKEQLEEPTGSRRLGAALRQAGLAHCTALRPDLTHATIYQQLSPAAVQYLLPSPEPAPPEYGFALRCSESR